MSAALDILRSNDLDMEDVIKRRRLPLAEIPPEDAKLTAAYTYWMSKRRNGLLPSRQDIDILELRPLVGAIHLVDVADPDPSKFRFKVRGSGVPPDIERKLVNPSLESCGSKVLGEAAMQDYKAVAATGTPCYQQVVAEIDYIRHSYARLLLPLAADGRRVDMLMVCINVRAFKDFTL